MAVTPTVEMHRQWPGFSEAGSLLIKLENTAFERSSRPVRYDGLICLPEKD